MNADETDHRKLHIPILDAVRGLAISLILLCHFMPNYLMPNRPLEWAKKSVEAGWVGVDLFFVLSGLLITDILLRSRNSKHRYKTFYLRRSIRILPLYLVTLFVVFVFLPLSPQISESASFQVLRSFQGWYWAHSSNVVVLLHGFEAMKSDIVVLAHFWSLAVEEHYYLLWPWVVWKVSEKNLAWVAVGIVVFSICFRLASLWLLAGTEFSRGVFYQLPARADSLAIGGLLALFLRGDRLPTIRVVAWMIIPIGLAILLIDFYLEHGLWFGSAFVCSAGFTILALVSASFIFLLRTSYSDSFAMRLFDNRPLRFLGKYSYGIYVLHGIAMPGLARLVPEDAMLTAIGSAPLAACTCVVLKSAVSVAAAMVSWCLLESPFLRLKRRFEYEGTTSLSAVILPTRDH